MYPQKHTSSPKNYLQIAFSSIPFSTNAYLTFKDPPDGIETWNSFNPIKTGARGDFCRYFLIRNSWNCRSCLGRCLLYPKSIHHLQLPSDSANYGVEIKSLIRSLREEFFEEELPLCIEKCREFKRNWWSSIYSFSFVVFCAK